jgi:glycosyltransferase involved in cell wall biosynthesis
MTPNGSGDKVAWEAMACGKPCVVANEGFSQTLGKYARQLTFRHGDSEDLAEKLAWVLSLSPQDRASIGAYLRMQVIQLHSLDRLASRLVSIMMDGNIALRRESNTEHPARQT